MIIKHAAIEDNWINEKVNDLLYNSNTLVLGSFNPNNPGNNTDFYYGRCSNFLWKVIAELTGKNEQYYCNNLKRKIETMEQYSFCFMDLIHSIEITSEYSNESIINDFVTNKIYSEYSDSVLFTSNTNYKNQKVNIKRTYNQQIIDVLKKGNINKVIHTLGNRTIDKDFKTKPIEKVMGNEGFQRYLDSILNVNDEINLINLSFSPSAYSVKKLGKENYNQLKFWLESHLIN